jgi:hypothetical protein
MNEPPCLICHKPCEPAYADSRVNEPINATVFCTNGHYGSEFDPMDGSFLMLNIHDECLNLAARAGLILHATPVPVPEPEPLIERWKGL